MENQANLSADPQRDGLLNTFCEITSASKSEALFFLESHNFDLDSAVSTFFENNSLPVPADVDDDAPASAATNLAARSPSRSRSPSPPRPRNSPTSSSGATGRRTGGIHTFSDLNRWAVTGSESDSDEPQEYYTGGEKSGMLVQDPSKANDVDAIFDQARRHAAPPPDSLPSSSARSFIGTARRLTGETLSATPAPPPESVTHTINLWTNGFTIDDGPLRRFDDPENASFLESIRKSECPQELQPEDRRTSVRVNLTRREEDCPVPEKCHVPFQGVGRTLGSTSNADQVESTGAVSSFTAAPAPSVGLVVDQSQPSTSIQLRLADGTRMVSRFNVQHTIRDIRGFIDASRPGGSRSYQLQTVGFPPKQLSDLNLTIEQAGLANSVVIQKL